ncbi:zinc-binding dehydrogenase [Nocardia nova]|uniref:zinc-binding dehydrogenase n=1 Tax=Nocardia nova TaxID=37330 RepID=UPI0034D6932E
MRGAGVNRSELRTRQAILRPGTGITAFHSDERAGSTAVSQRLADAVVAGVPHPNVDRVFALDDVGAAHHRMENDEATGKLVLLPEPTPRCPVGRTRPRRDRRILLIYDASHKLGRPSREFPPFLRRI